MKSQRESTRGKLMSLRGIIAIKTQYLEEISRMKTVMNKTINHMRRCHVFSTTHENSAESDDINEIMVEFEDVLIMF